MCTTSIDAQAYNNYIVYSGSEYYGNSAKTYYASDWANSSIRAWPNDNFYNTAFTNDEKSQIGTTYKLSLPMQRSRLKSHSPMRKN